VDPDISVIIPTFRRPHTLGEAVRSALGQEGVTVEVIVIDDSPEGSAEETIRSIADPRLRYTKADEPSGGRPAKVRNHGARGAHGRYLHFLDDDDRMAPGAYRALVSALEMKPRVGVAFGWVCPFGDDPAALQTSVVYFERAAEIARALPSRYHAAATILFRGSIMVNSSGMVRRECFEALGGYDPSIAYYEDVEFWMRGMRRYGFIYADRPILEYRTGAPSLMHDLANDWKPVEDSYRIIHGKYKAEHGILEYALLKLLSMRLRNPVDAVVALKARGDDSLARPSTQGG
jgi:glycosyltransferase involved in cell wall biosynthesis